jgi:hypothetical protein
VLRPSVCTVPASVALVALTEEACPVVTTGVVTGAAVVVVIIDVVDVVVATLVVKIAGEPSVVPFEFVATSCT